MGKWQKLKRAEKHLCWSLFLIELFQHRCFPQVESIEEAMKNRWKREKAPPKIRYDS